jgi:hypothetical protein
VVAAITSNIRRRLFGDHLIMDWKGAGLLFPSLVTAILRTVTREMIGSEARGDGTGRHGGHRSPAPPVLAL